MNQPSNQKLTQFSSDRRATAEFAILTIIFICFLAAPLEAQVSLDDFQLVLQNDSLDQDFDYTLLVHSGHRCGFCRKLRNDFQKAEIPENLKIIFIERDTKQEWIDEYAWSYRTADVYVLPEGSSSDIDFFPTSFLYDSDGKRIKRFKGYKKDFWEKVAKQVS